MSTVLDESRQESVVARNTLGTEFKIWPRLVHGRLQTKR